MLTANEILQKINSYLDNMSYERKPQSLYDPIKYVLSMGGKRIRPSLVLMAYNLYKDDPRAYCLRPAALRFIITTRCCTTTLWTTLP